METINLCDSDWVGIKDGLFLVNFKQTYNPEYFSIVPHNNTQKAVIGRIQPPEHNVKDLDRELSQLISIDRLKKALLKHFNSIDRLRCLSGDDALLKRRRITKYKATIKRYINQLKQDANFKLETIEKRIILCYSGKYVTARKVVVL